MAASANTSGWWRHSTPIRREWHHVVCIAVDDADDVVPLAWGESLHRGTLEVESHRIPSRRRGILQWPMGAAALREWMLRVINAR